MIFRAAVILLAFAVQQTSQHSFTVDQILGFPSPENLVASPSGSTIAWTFNERGVRNIYVASGPDFHAKRVTQYSEDDGQELTQLSFSRDGKTIIYVRGGDPGLVLRDRDLGAALQLLLGRSRVRRLGSGVGLRSAACREGHQRDRKSVV